MRDGMSTEFNDGDGFMLLELARPVTLLLSILSLLAVVHTAFFGQQTNIQQRMYGSLLWLALAAVVSLLSGLTFRDDGGQ